MAEKLDLSDYSGEALDALTAHIPTIDPAYHLVPEVEQAMAPASQPTSNR